MNKTILHLALTIVALATITSCNTPSYSIKIWSGDADIDWNESRFQRIEPALLDSLRPGDEIVISFDYNGESEWPVITLFDDQWSTMAGIGRIAITEQMHEASFYTTPSMTDTIRTQGFIVAGDGFNMTSVGIRHHDTPDNPSTLAWIGNTPMHNQQSFQDFSSRTFHNLTQGDILRFTFSNLKEDTAQFMLYTSQWIPIGSSHIITSTDSTFECMADQDLIDKATIEGLRISGKGFNVRRLDILEPLWQGDTTMNWFNQQFITLDSLAFSDINVGDYITLTIQYTGEGDYPQVALLDKKWGGINGAGKIRISPADNTITYCVTHTMYETLHQQGLIVTGVGYNLKAISIIHGHTLPGMDTASWIGNVKMNVGWTAFQQFPSTTFNSLKPGDIMRVTLSNVYDGARITLRSGNWNYIDGVTVSSMEPSENHFDFILTPEILKAIAQDDGLVVFGTNYTLNMMHLIKQQK